MEYHTEPRTRREEKKKLEEKNGGAETGRLTARFEFTARDESSCLPAELLVVQHWLIFATDFRVFIRSTTYVTFRKHHFWPKT